MLGTWWTFNIYLWKGEWDKENWEEQGGKVKEGEGEVGLFEPGLDE